MEAKPSTAHEQLMVSINNTSLFAKDIALSAARITAKTKYLSDDTPNDVATIAEAITMNVGSLASAIDDCWGCLSDLLIEQNTRLESVKKDAAEKIAAAQQSDCHPKHNSTIRKQVWDLTGGKCAYCDTALAPDGNGSLSFVVEHVVPTSQGGPDNLANYVPACMSCNTSKGADHVLLFIQRRFPNRVQRENPYVPERLA